MSLSEQLERVDGSQNATLINILNALGANATGKKIDELPSISSGIKSTVKIATGSYVGTGTYGAGNPNKIMLNFTPKIAIISTRIFSPAPGGQNGWSNGMIAAYPATKVAVYAYVAGTSDLTWGDDYFSWYTQAVGTNAERAQLNEAGTTYGWLILG